MNLNGGGEGLEPSKKGGHAHLPTYLAGSCLPAPGQGSAVAHNTTPYISATRRPVLFQRKSRPAPRATIACIRVRARHVLGHQMHSPHRATCLRWHQWWWVRRGPAGQAAGPALQRLVISVTTAPQAPLSSQPGRVGHSLWTAIKNDIAHLHLSGPLIYRQLLCGPVASQAKPRPALPSSSRCPPWLPWRPTRHRWWAIVAPSAGDTTHPPSSQGKRRHRSLPAHMTAALHKAHP